jgi:excisionase family DNA binding protein
MEQIKNSQRAYSVKSAAAQFDASIPFVRQQIRLGKLKAKKCGRKVLILATDLQNYLENQEDWKPNNAENN